MITMEMEAKTIWILFGTLLALIILLSLFKFGGMLTEPGTHAVEGIVEFLNNLF